MEWEGITGCLLGGGREEDTIEGGTEIKVALKLKGSYYFYLLISFSKIRLAFRAAVCFTCLLNYAEHNPCSSCVIAESLMRPCPPPSVHHRKYLSTTLSRSVLGHGIYYFPLLKMGEATWPVSFPSQPHPHSIPGPTCFVCCCFLFPLGGVQAFRLLTHLCVNFP